MIAPVISTSPGRPDGLLFFCVQVVQVKWLAEMENQVPVYLRYHG